MRIVIVGPGRAGGALALAASTVGHEIVGLVGRSPSRWDLPFPMIEADWPNADLVIIATRDRDIPEAASLVGKSLEPGSAVHISGATPVAALASLSGWEIGSFHPLQTLPDPTTGAGALAGSWVAVTATGTLRRRLAALADDLGMTDFDLADEAKPAYHAGAAAASNFLLAALDVAERLFAAAGVPFQAAAALSAEVLDNAFAQGALTSLTGPIARGDWDTVRLQVQAARELGLDRQYRLLAAATALTAGVEMPTDLAEP